MTGYRSLVLALGVLAVVGTTVGTSGLSSVSADRGTDVGVVDDEHAILGIERTPSGTANGTTNLTVTVTNRFGGDTVLDPVRVEAALDDAGGTITMLSAGHSGSVTLRDVPCDGYFTVHAMGTGVEVFLSRPVVC